MEPGEILLSLSNAGLGRVLPDIQKLLQESIRLTTLPVGNVRIPPGVSHFGGLPDLPDGFSWPSWKETPMSFVAQVNLGDILTLAPARRLPQAGLLSFFYDAMQETYGADPADRGGWKVLHFNAGDLSSIKAATAPPGLPSDALFKPCGVSLSTEYTLPTSASQHLPDLDWSRDEIHKYEEILNDFPAPGDHASIHHRMFGHPNQLQDDMQLQCALYENGVPSIDDPRAAALAQKKEDWQLLLQVDSDDNTGMKWATSGMLYYWIENRALDTGKFDDAWLVLQAE